MPAAGLLPCGTVPDLNCFSRLPRRSLHFPAGLKFLPLARRLCTCGRQQSGHPILLRTSSSAEHDINPVLGKHIKQSADIHSVLFAQLGMKWADVTVLLQFNAWGASVPGKVSGMKSLFHPCTILTKRSISTALVGLFIFLASLTRASDQSRFQVNPDAGAGDVIVRGKLGGLIFGFEVDPNGTEGLLCEARIKPRRHPVGQS